MHVLMLLRLANTLNRYGGCVMCHFLIGKKCSTNFFDCFCLFVSWFVCLFSNTFGALDATHDFTSWHRPVFSFYFSVSSSSSATFQFICAVWHLSFSRLLVLFYTFFCLFVYLFWNLIYNYVYVSRCWFFVLNFVVCVIRIAICVAKFNLTIPQSKIIKKKTNNFF